MTTIFPQLPGGNVLFCDDVRQEINGKITYVGVYNESIFVVGNAPVTMPSMTVAVFYRDDPLQFPKKLAFTITKKGDEANPLAKAEINIPSNLDLPLPPPEDDTVSTAEMQFQLRLPPLVVTEDFRIYVKALRDDDEVRLGSIRVVRMDAEGVNTD